MPPTLDAPEFRKAMEYAKETVLLLTNGTKVKHIWSDAFSTYLSASLASLRLSTGLNLNVFPPHAHSSNPVENCIRNSTRSCRKNIANLVGTVAQGKALTKDDVPEWWLHGYEYGIQRANTSPNATLLRRVGEGVNPLMIMTGDKSARLDLSKAHAFGEQVDRRAVMAARAPSRSRADRL